MAHYDYPLFRPPAEAQSLILQVTLGCSYNKCSFCSMYTTKSYKEKELIDIFKEIDRFALYHPDTIKVFLADGDALALPTEKLLSILRYLRKSFSKLRRVSCYASAQNLLKKTTQELTLLEANKLTLLYYGIETGSDIVLKKITKGVTQKDILKSLEKIPKKMKVSATIILGIGGLKYTNEHIQESASLVNQVSLTYLSTLQLGLEDNIKENFYKYFHDFTPLNDQQILLEQKSFLELLTPNNKIIFRSNHASNALHLAGTLPKDAPRLIQEIDMALNMGSDALIPNFMRSF